jgi:hypothetical protein
MKSKSYPHLRTMIDFAAPCTRVYTDIQPCSATLPIVADHGASPRWLAPLVVSRTILQFGYHAIHIVVENGNVTLTGVVDSDMDLAIAGMRANSVPGVFSVDNELQVAPQR